MNAIAPAFGCAPGGLPFEDALQRVLGLAGPALPAERVPLAESLGRVLASPFDARLDLPGFDQSAMDGYAVRRVDLASGISLPVTGRTAAGEQPARLAPGAAHRVLTGAPLPDGADAVIAQENLQRDEDWVRLKAVPPAGTNVRRRGEDIQAGTTLIAAGTTLNWGHLTLLAGQGACFVQVRRRPRVVVLSSGRELVAPGQELAPGQVHDSNLLMLTVLLTAWGASVRPAPIVPDNPAAMRAALLAGAESADIVLTTAGVSVGDEDHVRSAVRALGGDLCVSKVAMKPGKPLAAGRLGDAVFLGLPGNPQAALAGAVAFARPLLARMAGASVPPRLRAYAGFAMPHKAGRTDFIPVRLIQRGACIWAMRAGPDGSGRLAPLPVAAGLAFVSAETGDVVQGDVLSVLPIAPRQDSDSI